MDATLIVMAAGMGSRFGGLKQMEPIGPNGEAILDFSVLDAKRAGFNKVVFVIKEAIAEDFINLVGKRIEKILPTEYAFQEIDDLPEGFVCPEGRTKPWGTGQAILCCRGIVKEPFAIINADDYYGQSAFKQIYEQLKSDSENYCVVGYRLANTLTENGTVSRGVCAVENGFLKQIDERTKIKDCKYTEDDGETWVEMPEDTVVSMNFWGLNPDIFDFLDREFKAFLKEKINVPKSEFYIPIVIGDLVKNGEKAVKVLVAEDRWYGVTYKEDKPAVVKALGDLVASGIYENL